MALNGSARLFQSGPDDSLPLPLTVTAMAISLDWRAQCAVMACGEQPLC